MITEFVVVMKWESENIIINAAIFLTFWFVLNNACLVHFLVIRPIRELVNHILYP